MSEKAMIFDQMTKEHLDIEAILLELSKGYDKLKFKELRLALTAHMSAEEASLYPAISEREQVAVKQAEEAHKLIRSLLSKFGLVEPADFSSKLDALTEAVSEHFRAEEAMMPRAREALDQQKVGELTYLFHETERRIVERMK
ncbi:MAG: hemerythrin domain-containing protein [Methanomassiliicoccus sp.]|nr:hemerythrin domain-containing protein [Methanomassiliicoccus sp.]